MTTYILCDEGSFVAVLGQSKVDRDEVLEFQGLPAHRAPNLVVLKYNKKIKVSKNTCYFCFLLIVLFREEIFLAKHLGYASLHQRMVAEVVPPYTGRHRRNTLWLTGFKHRCQGVHEMTIQILAVAGI